MKSKKIKLIFISVFFVFLLAFSNGASAALVSCGLTSESADRCTLCHLLIGIRDIIDFGRSILVVAAIVAIVAGGIMYIVSAGDSKMMESAKGIIKQALWGILIVLCAWVIINTILFFITSKLYDTTGAPGSEIFMGIANWSTFNCDSVPSVSGSVTVVSVRPVDGVCPTGYHLTTSGTLCMEDTVPTTPPATGSATEDSIRAALLASGITVNRANACTDASHVNCTSVADLRPATISGVTDFKSSCGDSCVVVLTSGSEGYGIHSETGTYNHINGYKVDIRPNAQVDSYITTNYTRISAPRSDGAIGYRDSSGNTYYREGDHWDVTYLGGDGG